MIIAAFIPVKTHVQSADLEVVTLSCFVFRLLSLQVPCVGESEQGAICCVVFRYGLCQLVRKTW